MEKVATLSAVAGALLVTVGTDASAACMLKAVEGSTADATASQIMGAASKLTSAELVRQYGAPVSLKVLANGQQQMTWALASGELRVVADRATGKIKDVKMAAVNTAVDSVLAACAA